MKNKQEDNEDLLKGVVLTKGWFSVEKNKIVNF